MKTKNQIDDDDSVEDPDDDSDDKKIEVDPASPDQDRKGPFQMLENQVTQAN